MQTPCFSLNRIGGWSSLFLYTCITASSALGQVTPDGTLPTNVTQTGNTIEITGGAQEGGNLLHSFEEFSVPTSTTALFNPDPSVDIIINRVTGGLVSNIDGILQVNGNADFFLINPSGIVFGPNAALDVNGSFIASTADSLQFADGTEFSATDPQAEPLLTMSVPVGLQYGSSVGQIVNQSQASLDGAANVFGEPAGLQVQPNETLALVGGDVTMEGGNLTAKQGRIELGSVTSNSFVSLTPPSRGWELGYEQVQGFQDTRLSQKSRVNASGANGTIQVQGRHVVLTDGSQIFAGTVGSEPAGTLTVTASESVELIGVDSSGEGSALITQVESGATGNGGDLVIETREVIIRDGAAVSTSTQGDGQGGNLTINASEKVELIGTSSSAPSLLTTSSDGAGDGGELTINTGQLILREGAQALAVSVGSGKGGTITVNASEFVEVSGSGEITLRSTGSTIQVLSSLSASAGIEGLPDQPTGNSGDLVINTGELRVQNGAEVSVSNLGTGDAGTLDVNADAVILDQQGSLNADTASGSGGDINIQADDIVLLRNNSQISTNSTGSEPGGNIMIDTDFFVAVDEENSDITANATDSFGGRVIVNAEGIFGIEFREELTPQSDITASSELGPEFSGTVELNILEIDPNQGLIELPETLVDRSSQIQTACFEDQEANFIVTGRGGLAPNPRSRLSGSLVWGDARDLSVFRGGSGDRGQREMGEMGEQRREEEGFIIQNSAPYSIHPSTHPPIRPIVEAQGWRMNSAGQVELVAIAHSEMVGYVGGASNCGKSQS